MSGQLELNVPPEIIPKVAGGTMLVNLLPWWLVAWLLAALEHRVSPMDLAQMDGATLQRVYLAMDRWARLARRELDLRAGIAYGDQEQP